MNRRQRKRPPGHRTRIVCNQSSRLGVPIVAIAVHSTESQDVERSWDDLDGVGAWFDNPSSQASSHIGIDGDGHSVRWVTDDRKAWTILSLNPVTLNIEFVGRAGQSQDAWEDRQIRVGAKWAAHWCTQHALPAQRGRVAVRSGQPVITRKGIIRHSDLTDAGIGSHTDPGDAFPLTEFIKQTRHYKRHGWRI